MFFWYVNVCIFWKCIQYIIHWDKAQMLKQFLSDKINGTKNDLCFLLRVPAHHSFTFNLRFLWTKAKRFDSLKLFVGFSIFDYGSFLLKFIFLFSKMHGLFNLKYHNSSQNQNRKATHSFAPRPLIFKLQQKVLKFTDICKSWSSPKSDRPGDKCFKLRKLKFWERQFFPNSNF